VDRTLETLRLRAEGASVDSVDVDALISQAKGQSSF